ncbi:MAG: acetyl-CoA carboxylase carboxyltransferase subunit alpha [Spirochaetota bacterium]|nr:acetyl-CoA carboxylase carboxyltransferase subunit alpha [Spirochaetota bacterium]
MSVELGFEAPLKDLNKQIKELKELETEGKVNFKTEVSRLEKKKATMLSDIYSNLSAWEITQVARHPDRPLFLDYVKYICDDFIELHGDRSFGDDQAIVCGICRLADEKVVVIGHQRGRETKEKLKRNFGMARPEGYRKALRVMKMAEKFNRPIITFIDTVGAYPGLDAEERGQGEAIARNILEMAVIKTPIIAIVIGEGGSGGALALGVADRVMMLTNSIYSVISPEGCASILWKDAGKASEAAEALKITATDLLNFGLIDNIIEEPVGGAHRDHTLMAERLKESVLTELKSLKKLSHKKLIDQRHEKFIKMGATFE